MILFAAHIINTITCLTMYDFPTSREDGPPDAESPSPPPQSLHEVEAIYEDGVFKPLAPLDIPSGTAITLQIALRPALEATPSATPAPAGGAHAPASTPPKPSDVRGTLPQLGLPAFGSWLRVAAQRPNVSAVFSRTDLLLFGFGLLVYTLTRLIGLTRFPIYFFSDEAIQATLASDLLARGFRDQVGTLLPPFFLNDKNWNLSFSVYVHLISVALFGKSVLVTRATSALVSVLAAAAIALTLKLIFNSKLWWAGALVLSITPAWFLHSRTAFETVMMVSFYACFLCTYLLYRYRDPRYLYAALLFGGATFYSYTNGQGVMLISGVLLLLSDLRYHLRQKRHLILAAVLIMALLAVPLVRFRYLHPDAQESQLRSLYSYWLQHIPLSDKLSLFGKNYLHGLSPGYWFLPNDVDLERHRMKGMGHLPLLALPFVVIGLGICLRRWRSSAHRAIVIAILAAPFSAAIVDIAITRTLAMVVPATLLTILGLDQAIAWLRRYVGFIPLAAGCGALLTVMSFGLLRTALVDGPTWYDDYGLGGMQYGAEQLFTVIPEELAKSPNTRLLVSPSWANNTDIYTFFFLGDQQRQRVQMINVDSYLISKHEISPNDLFVMIPDEYKQAIASQKFVVQPPERIIPYPNGQPGFYFVRIRYADNVDAIFAAERQARQQLQEDSATLDGERVVVRHSQLDMGQVSDLFDNDSNTLMRGLEANPLVVEIAFPKPRSISSVGVTVGTMDFQLKVVATPADGSAPRDVSMTYRNLPSDPHVDLALPGGAQMLSKIRIELTNINASEVTHIHVRDISFH